MKVSTELTPDRQAIVTVEVDESQMQQALQRAAQHVSRLRPVSGFRPGKAPYNLVERTFGKELLVDEAIDDLSQTVYRQVLKENDLQPVDQGKLEVVQKEPPIFKFTIPIKPEVKLGDYHSIHMTPGEVTVSDEEVDQILSRYQLNQATMVPVTRGLQKGDTATLDVSGGVAGEEQIEEKGLRSKIGDEKQTGLPFEDQLIGMQAGETKEIDFAYPEDYPDEKFKGKTAHYKVTLQDLKETQLPDLSDEFAKTISQFDTLDQLRGNVRDVLRRQKEREEETRFTDQILDALVDLSEISFPPSMLEDQVAEDLERMKQDVKRLGLTWDKYLELAAKTDEQARGDLRPNAEKQLKRVLAVSELIDVEEIKVTREEVDAEIERRVKATEEAGGNPNVARRSYTTREARRNLEFNMRLSQAIGKLVAMAKGEAFSGRILTPDMVKGSEEGPVPTGLITDPSKVRPEEWPKGLERKTIT